MRLMGLRKTLEGPTGWRLRSSVEKRSGPISTSVPGVTELRKRASMARGRAGVEVAAEVGVTAEVGVSAKKVGVDGALVAVTASTIAVASGAGVEVDRAGKSGGTLTDPVPNAKAVPAMTNRRKPITNERRASATRPWRRRKFATERL